MSNQPVPEPAKTPTPATDGEQPRRRRGIIWLLLLLLVIILLLCGLIQFFTNSGIFANNANNGKGGQAGTLAPAAQTATAAATNAQGAGNASAAQTATAAAGGQGGAGSPAPAFNNAGIRDDANTVQANYDGSGNSYSAEALQAAKIAPGQDIVVNGVTFKWPNAVAGKEDNYQANGQVIPVTPANGATIVAFLGAASNGPSTGKGTLTYTDGTKQEFDLSFTDWTTRAGKNSVSFGNHVATTMPYRNKGGQKEMVTTYLFSSEVALQAGKTLRSVTLPTSADKGELHVFAVGTR
ncbi:MAG: hypothetical protein NVS4B9_27230 [Ktedonobacteraceae bacterium]